MCVLLLLLLLFVDAVIIIITNAYNTILCGIITWNWLPCLGCLFLLTNEQTKN